MTNFCFLSSPWSSFLSQVMKHFIGRRITLRQKSASGLHLKSGYSTAAVRSYVSIWLEWCWTNYKGKKLKLALTHGITGKMKKTVYHLWSFQELSAAIMSMILHSPCVIMCFISAMEQWEMLKCWMTEEWKNWESCCALNVSQLII